MTSQLANTRAPAGTPSGRGRGPRLQAVSLCPSRCPVPGCGEGIDPSRLMCRDHWYAVPRQVRNWVWLTWRSGDGATSLEHRDAVLMAVTTAASRR